MWKVAGIFAGAALAGGLIGYLIWPATKDSLTPNPAPQGQANARLAAATDQPGETHLTDEPSLELRRQQDDSRITNHDSRPTELTADFECGLAPNVDKISDTHYALDMQNKYEYWFYFKLTGVAGKTIRVDFKNIPLEKWCSLNPVYAYGTPTLADVPGPKADLNLDAVPTTLAKNGAKLPDTTGQPWHFISQVWASGGSTLSLVQTFDRDAVRIAMKTPFTVADGYALAEEAKKHDGVQVIEVGKSKEGRPLQLIKVSSGGDEGERSHPCILIYAREHADEHDSSWVATGALRAVLADDAMGRDLRGRFTFLVIPVLDADAAAKSLHENVILTFLPETGSVESRSYALFFSSWAREGNRLDVVLNMHNIESSEGGHLTWPLISDSATESFERHVHSTVRDRLLDRGYVVSPNTWWGVLPIPLRLGSWMHETFGTVHLLYEANSQAGSRHLSLGELEGIGGQMSAGAAQSLGMLPGRELLASVDAARHSYAVRWAKYGSEIRPADALAAERACLYRQRSDDLRDDFEAGRIDSEGKPTVGR